MKKIFTVLISILLLCGVCFCAAKNKVTPKDLFFDIERIKVDLSASSSMKELYNPEPWEQLQADVMAGKADRDECVRRIRRILATYKITHLYIYDFEVNTNPKTRPLAFYCFSDGYYVTSAVKKYAKYLGWKLKGVGDYSVEEVLKKISEIQNYETPSGLRYAFEQFITYEAFEEIGIAEKGKIVFTLESPEGVVETIKTKAVNANKKRIMIEQENITAFNHSWDASKSYEIKTVPETKTIYIPFNKVVPREDYSVKDWLNDIEKELKTGAYNTIVFDLRYNPGGMFMMLENFMYNHKSEFEKYNMALVTTGRTYSAATEFMDQTLRLYPNVKIFGEETGQAVFNYTGTYNNNDLKYLRINFYWPNMVDDVPELYARAKDIHRGTFPDVEVGETFEGYMKGEDSIYKAIYEYYKEE